MKLKPILCALSLSLTLACQAIAAVPPPDKLLASDTLVMLTVPDFASARATWDKAPMALLWNDASMKAFTEKFVGKVKSDVVAPFEREFGIKLSDYSGLAQGQVTFVVTQNGWDGVSDAKPGLLLLADVGNKAEALKTNLTGLRAKWVDSGKQIRTEKIRDVEFTTLVTSSGELKKTLKKTLGTADKDENAEDESDEDLAKKQGGKIEWTMGQSDALFIAGTSAKDIEKILIRQKGGSVPSLGEQASFSSSYNTLFRDSTAYGWVNTQVLIEALAKRFSRDAAAEEQPQQMGLPRPDRILAAMGLTGLQTAAFNVRDTTEGVHVNANLNIPGSTRRGLFKLLSYDAKDASPLPFVPADAVKFNRWRLDMPKAFATLEAMLVEISPQFAGVIKLLMDNAGKDKDPNFDLRKNLIGNLGDDIVSYEKTPRKQTLADLSSPPSIFLISSPKAQDLAAALQALASFMPQRGPSKAQERDFLGRKVYTLNLPPSPMPGGGKPVARTLHYAASGGYVALSLDVAMLEEYLRSSSGDLKALRDTPGLASAAQKVGGMGTGLFGFENQAETMRAAWEILKNESGTLANLFGGSAVAGRMNTERFNEWVDFSLLPSFDKVAKYFHISVWSGAVNSEGLQFKIFGPTPPQLKK